MRRLDAVWVWNNLAGTLTDHTQDLQDGSASISLTAGDKVYLGHTDWLAGFYADVVSTVTPVTYVVEQDYDGSWWNQSLEESWDQQSLGVIENPQANALALPGTLYWGKPLKPVILRTPSNTFPEAVAPPDTTERYWWRLRVTAGTVSLRRVLPVLYNAYATPDEVASFMGIPSFNDEQAPTLDSVRKMIAEAERWLDNFTLKSWRLRSKWNEAYDFMPAGFMLRHRPAFVVAQLKVWNGSTFDVFTQGRGQDYWVDNRTGRVSFTIPSFRLRMYSQLLQRTIRQPGSVLVSYTYGRDFDTDDKSDMVRGTVLRRVAHDMVLNADWTGVLTSGAGLDTVPKPDKARQWMEEAQQKADELRGLVTT